MGGANLLVEDGLHECVVIATDRMARVFRPGRDEVGAFGDDGEGARELTGGGNGAPGMGGTVGMGAGEVSPRSGSALEGEPLLVAWAGAGMPGLVRVARELSWSGLEGLVGVPGQLGGGVAMNAGGRWGELWDVVERVSLLTPEGEVVERARDACSPGYRDANLPGHVVLAAALRLVPGEKAAIRDAMRQYLSEKSAAQPVTEHSSGCVFRNPDPELSDGRSAGRLIDDCGGKGLAEGGAVVSPKHANFIVNNRRRHERRGVPPDRACRGARARDERRAPRARGAPVAPAGQPGRGRLGPIEAARRTAVRDGAAVCPWLRARCSDCAGPTALARPRPRRRSRPPDRPARP